MHVFQAFIQSWHKASDLHKILMHNVADLHKFQYATCRDYRLDSCILAPHRTMSCRMMKLRPASGSVHPPPHENWGDVSGSLHPHHKIADSLRLWALSVHSTRQTCGTSQALCMPMMKIADSLKLCAPPSRKFGDVSGSVHPHDENC